MKKDIENNQIYESKSGGHHTPCLHRCKVTKYVKGKEGKYKPSLIIWNRCRLKHNQNKNCSWPDNNETNCNVVKN